MPDVVFVEVFRPYAHLVLVVSLILVEGVVLVDVFHVGPRLVRRVVAFVVAVVVGRVALGVVNALVSVEYRRLLCIEVRAPEVVVVVVGWVLRPCVADAVVGQSLHEVVEFRVRFKRALLVVGEPVEAHVLHGSRPRGGGKGVSLRGLHRHLSPLRCREAAGAVHRHAALVELLAVVQYVLAHFAQVYVQVAAIVGSVACRPCIYERVEQPELDILYVGRLEVVGVEFSHHASPLSLGVLQRTVGVEACAEVVGAPFGGIVSHVEHVERRRGAVV